MNEKYTSIQINTKIPLDVVTSTGVIDIGYHWSRKWLDFWRQQIAEIVMDRSTNRIRIF